MFEKGKASLEFSVIVFSGERKKLPKGDLPWTTAANLILRVMTLKQEWNFRVWQFNNEALDNQSLPDFQKEELLSTNFLGRRIYPGRYPSNNRPSPCSGKD